jgi:hypothetical protein
MAGSDFPERPSHLALFTSRYCTNAVPVSEGAKVAPADAGATRTPLGQTLRRNMLFGPLFGLQLLLLLGVFLLQLLRLLLVPLFYLLLSRVIRVLLR